jgi:hypothetical protein
MVERTKSEQVMRAYQLGFDVRGTLYLTYAASHDGRPRISVSDPHWNANHGLRYVTWVTP